MKYNIKEKILSYLETNNKDKARAFVLSQLDADRFESTMLISSQQTDLLSIDELFDSDIEVKLLPQEEWKSTYWTKMCVELSNNFSKEKLAHILEVMTFLRKQGDKKFIPKQNNRSVKTNKKEVRHPTGRRTQIVNNKGYIEKAVIVGISSATGAVIGAGLSKGAVVKGAMIGGGLGAVVGIATAVIYTQYKNKNHESITRK